MARNPLGGAPDSDERLARNTSTQSQEPEVDRAPLYQSLGQDEGRADLTKMSEQEMEEFLRNEFMTGQILPACPPIPGYHICWLSTTNQYDTIAYRMRLGYTPVTQEDVPHMRGISVKTGEYTGMVGVNEMLLFKIPETAYQKLMHIMHHERPNQEEERLRANLEAMESGELSKGQPLVRDMGDGTEEMLKRTTSRAPRHWD